MCFAGELLTMFTATRGKTSPSYCLVLLSFSALVAKSARSIEVCNEDVYLGGNFGTHKGTFSSPGYPSKTYPNKERCTWIIKVPLDYRVKLYFNDFDVEYCSTESENCTCDYVEISDGQLLIDKPLAKFCGSEIPSDVTSSGRFVRVDLVTDELNTRKGFLAQFYSVSPDGVTPSSLNKHVKSLPTSTDLPEIGGNSTLMIGVMCSLAGVVLIGLILLFIYVKRNKRAQENQPSCAPQQLTSPVSGQVPSHSNHSDPPPYSSVVASAPPPYTSGRPIHT